MQNWLIFDRFSIPTWLQKSTNFGETSMPRCLPMLTSFFDRFFKGFGFQLRPPKPQNSLKFCRFYITFALLGVFKIRSIFDPILVPTCFHFRTKNPLKSAKKSITRGIKKMIDFWIDLFVILAPSWEPSWGHVGTIFR